MLSFSKTSYESRRCPPGESRSTETGIISGPVPSSPSMLVRRSWTSVPIRDVALAILKEPRDEG